MRTLLINQYYPPDTSATATVAEDMVKAISERAEVTVLAGRPSYNPTEKHGYYLLARERNDDVTVERVGSTGYDRSFFLGRVVNYITYLVLMPLRAVAIMPRPDVIVGMTDPPIVSIVGSVVSKLIGVPFVYVIQDLHPDMALAVGIRIPRPIIWLWEYLHRLALRRAAKVVVLGNDMSRCIEAKGVDRKRIHVVRSGSITLPRPETDGTSIRNQVRSGFEFVVMHAGNLGFAGDFSALIAAAKEFSDGVGLVLVGEGVMRDELQSAAVDLPNVRFLNYFPASELHHVLNAGDVQIVALRFGLEGLVVPSKLYSLLSAGRPVLATVPSSSDVAQIVETEGCGVTVGPSDVSGIVSATDELRRDPERLLVMGDAARLAADKYSRSSQLDRMVDLIETSASISGSDTE